MGRGRKSGRLPGSAGPPETGLRDAVATELLPKVAGQCGWDTLQSQVHGLTCRNGCRRLHVSQTCQKLGLGCPAASGIVSLRGREQGAGGSWGTLGSERRRPCLPTYEALAVSREACPRGSKDTPSTLSRSGAGALAGGQQQQEPWEWGGGDGGAERAQQQSGLQRRGLTSSDQPLPLIISGGAVGHACSAGPLFWGLSKRISKFWTCSLSCGFCLFSKSLPRAGGQGWEPPNPGSRAPSWACPTPTRPQVPGASLPGPPSSTPPPQAGEAPNQISGSRPTSCPHPQLQGVSPQPHPGSDRSGGTPLWLQVTPRRGLPSSRQTPTSPLSPLSCSNAAPAGHTGAPAMAA